VHTIKLALLAASLNITADDLNEAKKSNESRTIAASLRESSHKMHISAFTDAYIDERYRRLVYSASTGLLVPNKAPVVAPLSPHPPSPKRARVQVQVSMAAVSSSSSSSAAVSHPDSTSAQAAVVAAVSSSPSSSSSSSAPAIKRRPRSRL